MTDALDQIVKLLKEVESQSYARGYADAVASIISAATAKIPPSPIPSPPAAAAPPPLPEIPPEPEAPPAPPAAPAIDVPITAAGIPIQEPDTKPSEGQAPALLSARLHLGRGGTLILDALEKAGGQPVTQDFLRKLTGCGAGSVQSYISSLKRRLPLVTSLKIDGYPTAGWRLTEPKSSSLAQVSAPIEPPPVIPGAPVFTSPNGVKVVGRCLTYGTHMVMLQQTEAVIARFLVHHWGTPVPADELADEISEALNIKDQEAKKAVGIFIPDLNSAIAQAGLAVENAGNDKWRMSVTT